MHVEGSDDDKNKNKIKKIRMEFMKSLDTHTIIDINAYKKK